MFNGSGADFSEVDDVVTIMKIVFCRNYAESSSLPEHFNTFRKRFDEIKAQQEKLRKAREAAESRQKKYAEEYQKSAEWTKQKHSELQSVIDAENKKLAEEEKKYKKKFEELNEIRFAPKNPLTKKDKKFLENSKKKIDKLGLTQKQQDFVKEMQDDEFENRAKMKDSDVSTLKTKLTKMSEKALGSANLTEFTFYKSLFDIVTKMEKAVKKSNEGKQGAYDAIEKARKSALSKIQAEADRAKNEQREIQIMLDSKLKEMQRRAAKDKVELEKLENASNNGMKNIVKDKATQHRKDFVGAKNAVQTTDSAAPECIDKKFKQLSDKEKADIYNYIKKNLLKFKTKMNRNINTLSKIQINMQETIKNACKTGGIPLQLAFNKPTRSKSDLMLILDVSGSCKEASEMMLTFMYMLKDLFPRGCKTYAFIDNLYDVSAIMESENLEKTIETVLSSIPRNYSNYYRPLKSMWLEHRKDITKNSMVVFIGDARNNQNPHGTEYLKDISRKAKSCYWLNTETMDKWGHADSLAYEYAEYAKMYETTTVRDIIDVLNEMK